MNDDAATVNADGAGVAFRQPAADASPPPAPSAPHCEDSGTPSTLPREPYQVRVVQEKKELEERIVKLSQFFATDTFMELTADERMLLIRQHSLMLQLSIVLEARIAAFDA